MTPREIFEGKLKESITKEKAESIGGSFQFEISGDDGGSWYIDLTKDDNFVNEGKIDNPTCTVSISDEDWVGIIEGTVNAQMAFMSGKLKVAGDMGLALKLQTLLS